MPRASTRASLPRGQPGIQNFARTTKPAATSSSPAKPVQVSASPSKKRKLGELENVESGSGRKVGDGNEAEEDEKEEGQEGTATLTPSKSLKIGELGISTPRRSGHYVSSSKSVSAPKARVSSKRGTGRKAVQAQLQPRNRNRPSVYYDLVTLHSSFLKALTIHSAHNGPCAPADLREFLGSVERIWKKRKVVAKDLQRLIWIWDQDGDSSAETGHSYRLANYGLGKVCLERVIRGGRGQVDENQVQGSFEKGLESLWEKERGSELEGDGKEFVEMLGLSPIHESLTPFTSFRKGQQRLQDLKGGVIRLKTEKLRTENDEDGHDSKNTESASTRRKGLWDRIKSKQLRQSKLPPPPSKEMLLRRAAAERIEEVAGVLAALRPVGQLNAGRIATQRKPFRLEMVVQHVQDSTRNPISNEEVEICLELMTQVAGHWVNIVPVNQIKSVVLKSCLDVSLKEIGVKVGQMKVGCEGEALVG